MVHLKGYRHVCRMDHVVQERRMWCCLLPSISVNLPSCRSGSVLNFIGHAKLGMVSGEDIWYASHLDLAKVQGSIIA